MFRVEFFIFDHSNPYYRLRNSSVRTSDYSFFGQPMNHDSIEKGSHIIMHMENVGIIIVI